MSKQNNDFKKNVDEILRNIPVGSVTTYGAIAEKAGLRSGARMVGWILNSLKHDQSMPCHRVINRMGELSGSGHFPSPTYMEDMLKSEGIEVKDGRVDIKKYFWQPE